MLISCRPRRLPVGNRQNCADKQKGRGTLGGFRGLGGADSDSRQTGGLHAREPEPPYFASPTAPPLNWAAPEASSTTVATCRRGEAPGIWAHGSATASLNGILTVLVIISRAPPLVVANRAVSSIAMVFEVFGQASTAERTVRRRSRGPQTIYRQFAKLAGSCRSDGRISRSNRASGTLRGAVRTLRDRCLCHLTATSAGSRTRPVLPGCDGSPCLGNRFVSGCRDSGCVRRTW